MASSRHSQNTIDLTDVAVAWAAFETINSVEVTIDVRMVPRGANREPKLYGVAFDHPAVDTGQQRSALASANCWAFDYRSLDAAIFHLLYTLDGSIASAEFERTGKNRA